MFFLSPAPTRPRILTQLLFPRQILILSFRSTLCRCLRLCTDKCYNRVNSDEPLHPPSRKRRCTPRQFHT
jgi:hypothetical protein